MRAAWHWVQVAVTKLPQPGTVREIAGVAGVDLDTARRVISEMIRCGVLVTVDSELRRRGPWPNRYARGPEWPA